MYLLFLFSYSTYCAVEHIGICIYLFFDLNEME